jgi:NAD(P)-dependent dehydrogenase (short-subunit alcohol dehydrogenase family)
MLKHYFLIFFVFTTLQLRGESEIKMKDIVPEYSGNKVVLLTGCSRGIGFVTALKLVQEGYTVYATMRNTESGKYLIDAAENAKGKLYIRHIDVTNEDSIQATIEDILSREGRIDVLVNNAGWGLKGTAEGVSIDQAQKVFDTNFFGMLRLIQATLPSMRQQAYGRIINISSLAAIAPLPGWDIYAASKQAVETLSEAMLHSLEGWNINISVIEPGPITGQHPQEIGTRFLGKKNPYAGILEASKKWIENQSGITQPAEEVAELIQTIIETEAPKFRYQTNATGKKMADQYFRYNHTSVLDLNSYISTE